MDRTANYELTSGATKHTGKKPLFAIWLNGVLFLEDIKMGKLLCLIGWHTWTWKYERGTTLFLDAPPPDHATCERCGVRFGKKK
jgi:hypothetical protein